MVCTRRSTGSTGNMITRPLALTEASTVHLNALDSKYIKAEPHGLPEIAVNVNILYHDHNRPTNEIVETTLNGISSELLSKKITFHQLDSIAVQVGSETRMIKGVDSIIRANATANAKGKIEINGKVFEQSDVTELLNLLYRTVLLAQTTDKSQSNYKKIYALAVWDIADKISRALREAPAKNVMVQALKQNAKPDTKVFDPIQANIFVSIAAAARVAYETREAEIQTKYMERQKKIEELHKLQQVNQMSTTSGAQVNIPSSAAQSSSTTPQATQLPANPPVQPNVAIQNVSSKQSKQMESWLFDHLRSNLGKAIMDVMIETQLIQDTQAMILQNAGNAMNNLPTEIMRLEKKLYFKVEKAKDTLVKANQQLVEFSDKSNTQATTIIEMVKALEKILADFNIKREDTVNALKDAYVNIVAQELVKIQISSAIKQRQLKENLRQHVQLSAQSMPCTVTSTSQDQDQKACTTAAIALNNAAYGTPMDIDIPSCDVEMHNAFGGGKPGKVKVLGRVRNIHTIRGHAYVTVQGQPMLLSKARKLEKSKKKPESSK